MITSHQKIDFDKHTLIEKVTITPPFHLTLNFPDDACFIFFDKGHTKINAPFEQKHIATNEAVLLRCGTYFSDLIPSLDNEDYEILVFHLPRVIIREIYQNEFPASLKSNNSTFIHPVGSSKILTEFIKGLHFYFNNPAIVTKELLQLKIQELVLLLLQTNNISKLRELFNDTFSPVEVSIKEVVFSHIFTDCSINDIAELCNVSISTFNRQFKKIFDSTPSKFFKTKRLEKAKDLLKNSNQTISEIAAETCFYDTAHFDRSFKTYFGYTPGEFRKSN